MTTKIAQQELKVNWQYSTDKKRTTCYMNAVQPDGSNKPVGSITINLYYKDHFEYEKARKTSLKRLLLAVELPKEARTEIWAAYFARKPKKQ
jgi:hypothetical protein